MPEPKKLAMPPEVRRLYNLGSALGSLPKEGPVWQALEELIANYHDGTRLKATDPDQREDKRAFYAGGHYVVDELRTELREFQNGQWRNWPAVAEWRRANGGTDGDGD